MTVPANAELWFNGTKTSSTGAVREFSAASLTPGVQYAYEVLARWTENGQEKTQSRTVYLTAGDHVNLTFPVSSGTAEQIGTSR